MTKEFEFELLSTGEVRFKRHDSETNGSILDLLKVLKIKDLKGLQDFLESSDPIIHVVGTENFCG